ncbi:MFS transporter [Oceanobacillus sp. FSL K6-0118]|uniref:MFS transporter n=1 Tax=Bacillaceae TaxID=186817 RepID=UPI00119F75E6|nr:MFS transporter [Virgibacillus sp. SK37]
MSYIQKGTASYRKALFALFSGSFVTFSLLYSAQPLIPIFSSEFGVSPTNASLSLSFSTGVLAIVMLFTPSLSNSIGRKQIMSIALLVASILSILTAITPNFSLLLLSRALLGAVLAGFPSIAMTYISEEFHPKELGTVMGIYISGNTVGGLSGRIVTSALTDWFSWEIALFIIGGIALFISIWFWRHLPEERHFVKEHGTLKNLIPELGYHFKNPALLCLYGLSFLLMGSFVTLYNYITYLLIGEPYHLSHAAVGSIFFVYLVGTFSSTFMGNQADRHGKAKVLPLGILIMTIGAIGTLYEGLWLKIVAIAIFTFGFFGSHSIASAWVGQKATAHKAQASSLYLLFYYGGSSLFGTLGGIFWSNYGWNGVIGMISVLLVIAFVLVGILVFSKSTLRSR